MTNGLVDVTPARPFVISLNRRTKVLPQLMEVG
jgi:hypothetical protein